MIETKLGVRFERWLCLIMMTSHYDAIVIVAGLQGLAAAHIHTQLESNVNLRVIDSNNTVGGTWTNKNLYPGLGSNNLVGTYE